MECTSSKTSTLNKSASNETRVDSTSLECPICYELVEDPRALPCGHCFCGPPRNCLGLMKHGGGIKCAICSTDHNLKVEELKPLYGIRDFLQRVSSSDLSVANGAGSSLMCTEHEREFVTFWCKKCAVRICNECLETAHDTHPIVRFRKFWDNLVGEKFDRYSKIALNKAEETKTGVESLENFIRKLEEQKQLLEDYNESVQIIWNALRELNNMEKVPTDAKIIDWVLKLPEQPPKTPTFKKDEELQTDFLEDSTEDECMNNFKSYRNAKYCAEIDLKFENILGWQVGVTKWTDVTFIQSHKLEVGISKRLNGDSMMFMTFLRYRKVRPACAEFDKIEVSISLIRHKKNRNNLTLIYTPLDGSAQGQGTLGSSGCSVPWSDIEDKSEALIDYKKALHLQCDISFCLKSEDKTGDRRSMGSFL